MSWPGEPQLMLFRGIGPGEIVIILAALMLLFGATRLPKMGASLGQSLRAFKTAVTGQDVDDVEDTEDKKAQPSLKDEEKS